MNANAAKLAAIALLAGLVAAGCGMGDDGPPQVHVPPTQDGGVGGSDGTQTQSLQQPIVDPISGAVCTDTVPMQGTAPAGTSVFVVGGATTGLPTDADPITGRSCLDVPLNKHTLNTFQVRAQDPVKGMSAPVSIKVQHSKCDDDVTKPTPEQPKSKNVALGAKGKSKDTPDEGNEGFLTDGSATTFAKYSGGWAGYAYDGWVRIKLDKLYMVEKIVVKWNEGKNSGGESYGAQYKVLVSSMSDPGDPDTKNGYWTTIADVTSGDGDTDTYDLTQSKPLAQYVAVWMEQDGNSWTWKETFKLAEIEVWNVPKKSSTSPTSQANTCATIGSGS